MKKLIAMAAVAMTMMMASCSGDDSESTDNPSENGPLLTKMIETYDGETVTTLYTYDGNKLTLAAMDDGSRIEYFYTSGKLSLIKYYYYDETTPSEEETFEYNADGTLAAYTELWYDDVDGDSEERFEFTYNDNGTITTDVYFGDLGEDLDFIYDGVITMNNGNVISYITDSTDYTYTFDSKNSPEKNVFAFDILAIAYRDGGVNNLLTSAIDDNVTTFEYTYNSDNYPTLMTGSNDENEFTIQYFYE